MRKRTTYNLLVSFIFLIGLGLSNSHAEGTKETQPNASDAGFLALYSAYNNFALYNATPEERLNINICNAGEIIYFGFRQDDNDIRFRLRAPDGSIVIAEQALPTNGQTGYIGTHGQAVAGPQQIVGGTGYDAFSYTSTMAGDYYIEFTYPGRRRFTFWDITVADPTGTNAINGRVWSKEWLFSTGSFNNSFEGTLFVYADDGIVTTIGFNGIQPYVFTIACNATGVVNNNDPNEDRKSVRGNSTYAQYKIFLNDPDENCYPTGTFGNVIGNPNVTGCGTNRCINIVTDQNGQAIVLLDLNGVPGFQPNTSDVQIQWLLTTGANCVPWDGNDGNGNPVVSGTMIDVEIDYLNGITHLPIYDVENHRQGYNVTLVRPAGPAPQLFWDDIDNIPNGTQELNGCISPCHTWQWNNAFQNRVNEDYGNRNTINTWWYANIVNRELDLTVVDLDVDANVNIPGKGADNDTTICADNSLIQLAGQVTGAPSGQWTSSGDGTFSSGGTDQQGTYTMGPNDFVSGSFRLTLTSVGGVCGSQADYMDVSLQPVPTVDAGGPYQSCSSDPTVTLGGSFGNANGIEWTGGNGIFVPNRFTSNATYTPDSTEIASGSVTLTLTTTGNGVCDAATSTTALINILPQPEVITGDTISVCNNTPDVSLNGVINNATGGTWSGGLGSFQNGNQSVDIYTPTQSEIDNGSLTLTLTSQGQASVCSAESSDLIITFIPTPTADAGSVSNICENDTILYLNGSVTGTNSFFWSGGSGVFDDSLSTSTSYNVSNNDINSGSISFTLTAVDTNGCLDASDIAIATINPGPSVDAGISPLILCSNNQDTTISVTLVGAAGVQWTGSGGTFSPNSSSTTVNYTASLNEINSGATQLYVETTGNGGCPPAFDTIEFVYLPEPQIALFTDQITVCENSPTVNLNGSVTFATSVEWLLGNGTFSPNRNQINTQYTPTTNEINNGQLDLIISADRQSCLTVYDTVNITIEEAPVVEAGSPQTVCANNPNIQLNGSVLIANGGIWEGGNGIFTPANDNLNALYTPTPTEISNGFLKLYLRSLPFGSCNDVIDSVEFTFTAPPTIDIGPDIVVCENNADVILNAVFTQSTGVRWTSNSNGPFRPNPFETSPNYIPSNPDKSNGSVEIYATTTGNGNCNPVSDTLNVSITPSPTIDNFREIGVCGENPEVTYSPNITNAGGVRWSGGNGTYSPNDSALIMSYTPSISEIQAGSASITVTTTNNGLCNAIQLSRLIRIQPVPIVNAGNDMTVCGTNLSIQLNGTSQNSVNGARWFTNGSGSIANNNELNTVYNAVPQDTTNSPILIWLESSGNRLCNAQYDTIEVTFIQEPIADAGADNAVFCSNQFPFQLNGSGSAGNWIGGNGTFSPSRSVLNPTYNPTPTELNNGSLTLTYQTTPFGPCNSVSDNVQIQLIEGPEANAGNDQTICGNAETINLNGTINNASNSLWTTNGTGSISPSTSDLNVSYNITSNDTLLRDTSFVNFVLATTGSSQCPEAFDTITVKIAPTPYINAGPDQTLCALNGLISLNGDTLNTNQITWNGGNGGTFSPNANSIDPSYTVNSTDTTIGFVDFIISSTGNTVCNTIFDTVRITLESAPIIDAGNNITICGDSTFINLSGSVSNATDGFWTSDGTGNFSPNGTGLNTSYFLSTNDFNNSPIKFFIESTGNGNCPPNRDSLEVTITPTPTIVISNDTTICEDVNLIPVSASIEVATDVVWSSSGNGSFSSPNGLSSNYIPTAQDIANGIVIITATTTNSGNCNEVNDQMIITFSPPPTVFAGLPQTVCASNNTLNLNGSVDVASGVVWTTNGNGTINTPNQLATTYSISPADTSAGFVDFFIQTTGNGSCNTYFDTIRYTFQSTPIINVINDFTVCADSLYLEISATSTNNGGITWSTLGDGNFFPSQNIDTTFYSLTSQDTTLGEVIFIAQTTGSGICPETQDTLTVTILPTPVTDAGVDQTICADSNFVQLNGTVTNAGGAYWITSGTGTFNADSSQLNANYIPSSIDTTLGQVTLTLISSNNGLCNAVRSSIDLEILPEPIIDAGNDFIVCAEQAGIQINASISNSNNIEWFTSGTGVFGPNNTVESPIYFPSASDTSSGEVSLFVVSSNNSPCKEKSDTITLQMLAPPIANAGLDQTVCANSTGIQLNGTTLNSSSSIWSTSGSGKFTPSANSLTASYVPTSTDTTNGSVTIYLDAFSANSCSTDRDSLTITFEALPIVDAGNDISICRDLDFVNLNGSINNAPGGIWATSGDGYFAPTNTNVPGQYLPDGNDTTLSFVTLTLTSTGTLCPAATDNMILTFTPIPTVNAGNELTVCVGIDSIQLSGFVTQATGGRWRTFGSGTFTDELSLNTYYKPSVQDSIDGTVLLELTSSGSLNCLDYTDTIRINFGLPFIDAGDPATVCDSDFPIILNASGTSGEWVGGAGVFNPNRFSSTAQYTPSNGEVISGNFKLYRSSINNGSCAPVEDSVEYTIIPGPTLDAISPANICDNDASTTLSTTVTVASQVRWSTTGTGTFDDDQSLTPNYSPSTTDFLSDTVEIYVTTIDNGLCNPVTDTVRLNIENAPGAFTGNDVEICEDNPVATLEGAITIANTSEWESVTGNGVFSPDRTLLATEYTLDANEIATGRATVILKTTDNGNCRQAVDTLEITVLPSPIINAGLGGDLCPGDKTFDLMSSVSNAAGGRWTTSGNGTFSPSDTSRNATYNLGSTDVSPTTITVTYTSFGNGLCNAVSDDTVLNFVPAPVATAGNDQELCDNTNTISLNGIVQNATGGKWISTGSGTFTPNDSTLNASYIPSVSDQTNQVFNIILTTTGNGFCDPDIDAAEINLIEAPIAIINAGTDIDVCSNSENIILNGFFRNADGVVWSTTNGGGNFSPSDSLLKAIYQPIPNDTTLGSIEVVLRTYGNNACGNTSDTVNINFIPSPSLNIGNDILVCEDSIFVNIGATYSGANGVSWFTSGDGSFSISSFEDSVFYTFGNTDITNRGINISAQSISNGYCESIQDELRISIESPATITASNVEVCETSQTVTLNSLTSDGSSVYWTTTGSGNFIDSLISNPAYNISTNDVNQTAIGFTVTNNSINSCGNQSENMIARLEQEAVINAGPNQDICENNSVISSSAIGTNYDNITWRSLGTGQFRINPNSEDISYQPSISDISNGSVELTVNAQNNSSCPGVFDTLTINFTSAPTVTLSRGQICELSDGVQLTANVNIAAGGTWNSTGDGSFSTNNNDLNATYFPTLSEFNNGDINITLTTIDNGNCAPVSSDISIPAIGLPVANAGSDKYTCNTVSVTLQAEVEQNTQYNWLNTSGTLLNSDVNFAVNPTTTTDYILEATNSEGCSTYDTITVNIFTLPTLNLPENSCFNDSLLLNSNPTNLPNVPGVFQWTRDRNYLQGQNAPIHYVEKSGTHAVIYNYGACATTDTSVIFALPTISIADVTGCSNEQVELTTNEIIGASYSWSVDQNPVSGNSNTVPYILGNSIDTNFYKVEVVDINNCISNDSAELITIIKPIIILEDSNNCAGSIILLDASPQNYASLNGYDSNYEWEVDNININHNFDTLNALSTGKYKATLSIDQCITSDSAQITYDPNPSTGIKREEDFCSETDTVFLVANEGLTYLWEPSGNSERVLIVYEGGEYSVTVTNSFGCTDTDTSIVTDICPPRIFIPDAFVPTQPGDNDKFYIKGKHFVSYEIRIYNRWGEVIFHAEDPNLSWDGTYLGELMPVGSYPYIVKYEGIGKYSGIQILEGMVTLIR